MTYDQWKDPTPDTSEQERAEAEYMEEILIEYAAEMSGWELVPDWQSDENQSRSKQES